MLPLRITRIALTEAIQRAKETIFVRFLALHTRSFLHNGTLFCTTEQETLKKLDLRPEERFTTVSPQL